MANPIKSLKDSLGKIPTKYRFWLSLGILAALLIALPITLIGLMTGTFELRKRAVTAEPTPSPPVVIFGNAALFDNPYEMYQGYLQTQYIKTEESPSLIARQQMTIEAWIQLMDRGPIEDQVIIAKKAGGDQFVIGSYWLSVSPGLRLKFSSSYIRNPVTPEVISNSLESNEVLKPGCWYHVAISIDNPRVRMFINGHLDIEGDFGQFPAEDVVSKVSIAANLTDPDSGQIDAPAYLFNGEIDEVRLSSIARYTSSFSIPFSPYPVDSYTMALWHFDYKTENNTVSDDSPNANQGLVMGDVTFIPSGASVLCAVVEPPLLADCRESCGDDQDCQPGLLCGTPCPPEQVCILELFCYNASCPYDLDCICSDLTPTPVPCVRECGLAGVYPNAPDCCPGLERKTNFQIDSEGNCRPLFGSAICLRECGDGQCLSCENYCNCPEDCPLPTPTPTVPTSINLRIRFGGVTSRPVDDSNREVKIYATNLTGGPDLASADAKLSIPLRVDDSGVYSMEFSLDRPYFGHRYRLRVKGPKHLQSVFPDVFFQAGVPLDLTNWPLRPGDLDQDGKVDINDLRAIKVFSTDPADIAFGDVNFDNRVDIFDRVLVLGTLSVQYDPD